MIDDQKLAITLSAFAADRDWDQFHTPKNLATQELFQLDTRLLKFSEAMSYQDRIEKNHRRNEQIGIAINRGIKLACAAPLIYLLLLLALYLIAPSSFRP